MQDENSTDNEIQVDDPLSPDGDSDEVIPYKYSITSYGADYTIDSLVKRIKEEDIYVPMFQRGYVWNQKAGSRFIESLLLGLPVPGIFLAKEHETQKLLVIDGQQRLFTLMYFYDGVFADTEREFRLRDVQERFEGRTYKTLKDEDRRRLNDSILHATVIKQDEPSNDDSSIYHIFERINTAGIRLTSQEIRTCIYHGKFVELLKEMNANENWRRVYGGISKNMRDQELILRFLAMYFNLESYSGPMKAFLNEYMGGNRNLEKQSADELREPFESAIAVIAEAITEKPFRPISGLNTAVYDSVMVAVAKRLEKGAISDLEALSQQYYDLMKSDEYLQHCTKATANEGSVRTRMDLAISAFSQIA